MRHLLFFLLAAIAATGADAQFYNNGVFYVGNTGLLYVNSNYTNTAAASYQNDGTVHITGQVTNDQASMAAGAGTTIFDGTTLQQIGGASPFRCKNITLNNIGGLVLNDRLAIGDGTGGTLTFSTGLITSGTSTQDVYFYPGSGYAGFDANHHIVGFTTKSGATDFDFPIGNGTRTADITLSVLTGSSDFEVQYNGSPFANTTTAPPLVPNGVFTQEWWDVARTAGSASAEVSLIWNDALKVVNHTNPSSLVVAHFTGGVWTSVGGTSVSPANAGTGVVGPSTEIGSFSPFTFGSTTTPLPITLGAFTVTNQGCQAYLNWTTTLELNAATFEVQQSTDGVHFGTVATVKADDAASDYHLSVPQTMRQAFYRLQMTDRDGSSTYSWIDGLTLDCLPNTRRLFLYPNPVSTGINMQAKFTSPDDQGMANLQVFDAAGRKVYTMTVRVAAGDNLYTLPTIGMAQGGYTVLIYGEGWQSDAIHFSRSGN